MTARYEKELRYAIARYWKEILDTPIPEEWLEEIEEIVKEDSDFPRHNYDDIKIGFRNFINMKLEWWG